MLRLINRLYYIFYSCIGEEYRNHSRMYRWMVGGYSLIFILLMMVFAILFFPKAVFLRFGIIILLCASSFMVTLHLIYFNSDRRKKIIEEQHLKKPVSILAAQKTVLFLYLILILLIIGSKYLSEFIHA